MARLNQDRQKRLEPRRMKAAQKALEKLGYEVLVIGRTQLRFEHRGKLVNYFPYSGWASGSTIKDGRGLQKLLNQLK